MPYATKEDMEQRFSVDELIQLTDKERLGVFGAETFAQAQKDGDADIDIRIGGSYPLPLEFQSTALTRWACDIYRFYLYGDRVPDFAQSRYDAAIKCLDQVKAGRLSLNQDVAQQQPVPNNTVKIAAAQPVYTDDSLRNY